MKPSYTFTSLLLTALFIALAFAPELAAPALVGAIAAAFLMYVDTHGVERSKSTRHAAATPPLNTLPCRSCGKPVHIPARFSRARSVQCEQCREADL